MRTNLLPLLLLTVASCAQQDSVWHEYEVDEDDTYPINAENEIYLSDFDDLNDVVTASILVRNERTFFGSIKFSSATLVGDTLTIKLHTTTPAYQHEYLIIVIDKKYTIQYRFALGDGLFDELLAPLKTMLKVNTSHFKKGATIRGYTGFKSKCIAPCDGGLFFASGNFKATIK